MKKIIIFLLSGSLALSLVSCKKHDVEESLYLPAEDNTEAVYKEFTWPMSDIAKLIPVPKSSFGRIEWEASYGFVIYVAETPKEDYDEYVMQCQEAGFMEEYSKGDDYFWADNAEGYHVNLRYEGDDVMFVRLDEPNEDTDELENENGETADLSEADSVAEVPVMVEEDQDTAANDQNNGADGEPDDSGTTQKNQTMVTPEFKAMLDSYEAFFNEYAEFMKKYKNSNDTVSMMGDLAEYMTKYADMMQKLNDINSTELTAADSAYYLEVTARIMKRLSEIS